MAVSRSAGDFPDLEVTPLQLSCHFYFETLLRKIAPRSKQGISSGAIRTRKRFRLEPFERAN